MITDHPPESSEICEDFEFIEMLYVQALALQNLEDLFAEGHLRFL